MRRSHFGDLWARIKVDARRALAAHRLAARPDGYTWIHWGATCWTAGVLGWMASTGAERVFDIPQRANFFFFVAFVLSGFVFALPLRGRRWAPFSAAKSAAQTLLTIAGIVFLLALLGVLAVLIVKPAAGRLVLDILGWMAASAANTALFALLIPWWLASVRETLAGV